MTVMTLEADTRTPFRFMTLDPGHFHAGLVQKEMYPDVSATVDVYAPEGPVAHTKKRLSAFGRPSTGISQYSAESLMIPQLQAKTREEANQSPTHSGS